MPKLPISIESVRDELSGSGMDAYLSRIGDLAHQDSVIRKAIKEAQSEIEIELSTRIFQTKIVSRPVADGLVRGVDFNEIEDAYPFFSMSIESPGSYRTKLRPIAVVDRVEIRYGSTSRVTRVLEYPKNWLATQHKFGIIDIVPIMGLAAGQSGTGVMLPLMGIGLGTMNVVPGIVGIDYTAGFLRSDYDPDFEYDEGIDAEDLSDPRVMSPDQDVTSLLAAIRYIATGKVLTKLNRAVGAGGGSIGLDGLSQSFQAARFLQEVKEYQEKANEIKQLYKSMYSPPRSFVM